MLRPENVPVESLAVVLARSVLLAPTSYQSLSETDLWTGPMYTPQSAVVFRTISPEAADVHGLRQQDRPWRVWSVTVSSSPRPHVAATMGSVAQATVESRSEGDVATTKRLCGFRRGHPYPDGLGLFRAATLPTSNSTQYQRASPSGSLRYVCRAKGTSVSPSLMAAYPPVLNSLPYPLLGAT